jgi:hypothetical protein
VEALLQHERINRHYPHLPCTTALPHEKKSPTPIVGWCLGTIIEAVAAGWITGMIVKKQG